MDKATFQGSIYLIDDWTSFDNERFETIRANSDMLEEVTSAELALMANVKAVIVDEEWFQVYDNQNKFTEVYVSSGEYWNYNYNVWKTVSSSPFSNAVVFVTSGATITNPATLTFTVDSMTADDFATIFTLVLTDADGGIVTGERGKFVQTEDDTENGIAVHPYGAYIIPTKSTALETTPTYAYNGDTYTMTKIGDTSATAMDVGDIAVGSVLTLTKVV